MGWWRLVEGGTCFSLPEYAGGEAMGDYPNLESPSLMMVLVCHFAPASVVVEEVDPGLGRPAFDIL